MPICELVKAHWEQIGIEATCKETEGSLYTQRNLGNELVVATWHPDRSGLLGVDPLWFGFTSSSQQRWAVQWATWFTTNGAEGEEPPAEIQELKALFEEFQRTLPGTPEFNELGAQYYAYFANELPMIGTVGLGPVPMLVSNRLHNVPAENIWWGRTPTSMRPICRRNGTSRSSYGATYCAAQKTYSARVDRLWRYRCLNHIPVYQSLPDLVQVVALVDLLPENLVRIGELLDVSANQRYQDYRTLLTKADLDAVMIATPHSAHAEQVMLPRRQGWRSSGETNGHFTGRGGCHSGGCRAGQRTLCCSSQPALHAAHADRSGRTPRRQAGAAAHGTGTTAGAETGRPVGQIPGSGASLAPPKPRAAVVLSTPPTTRSVRSRRHGVAHPLCGGAGQDHAL
ncbi:MAG: hypothetical protein R3E79_53920 [Caldilineaceae bacterium]